MSVAFYELAGSPREDFSAETVKAEREVLVAWESRHTMVQELLGEGYAFGAEGRAPYPGFSGVVAMRARIEAFNPSPDAGQFSDIRSDLNSYNGRLAKVTIYYELIEPTGMPDPPDTEEGTLLTYRIDFGGESLLLPGQGLKWENQPNVGVGADQMAVLRVPVIEHHLTWHRVIDPPWTAIRDCVGCVNNGPFMGAAAGTVLFDGATTDKEFVGLGSLAQPELSWKIRYVFREKAIKHAGGVAGWNHQWRALPNQQPDWDRLLDRKNNQPLYATTDFASLFRFSAIG